MTREPIFAPARSFFDLTLARRAHTPPHDVWRPLSSRLPSPAETPSSTFSASSHFFSRRCSSRRSTGKTICARRPAYTNRRVPAGHSLRARVTRRPERTSRPSRTRSQVRLGCHRRVRPPQRRNQARSPRPRHRPAVAARYRRPPRSMGSSSLSRQSRRSHSSRARRLCLGAHAQPPVTRNGSPIAGTRDTVCRAARGRARWPRRARARWRGNNRTGTSPRRAGRRCSGRRRCRRPRTALPRPCRSPSPR